MAQNLYMVGTALQKQGKLKEATVALEQAFQIVKGFYFSCFYYLLIFIGFNAYFSSCLFVLFFVYSLFKSFI
jgi:hypothetical protein